MARDISVELSVQGEREFNRQLKEAQSAVKVLGSELKASEAQFKGGEDAQERYANRTRILGDQIEQERIIIERLTKAVETAGNEFGQTDAKTDKYRIALNRARENAAKMEKQLAETDREMEELGRDSVRVGRQLEDGIGESAEKASGDIEKMVKALETDFKSIASSVSISAATDFGKSIIDVGQSIADFAESTRESRRQFGFLQQNAIDAGMEYDIVLQQLKEIQALTGEEDSAIEGISDLLAAGFDTRELTEAIDLLGGAVIRFPDTLKFESLADSLQETVATGAATGAYGELLERLGVDIDEFNKAMSEAQTTEEKQQIALAYLNEHGLKETKEGYEAANQSMIDAESAAFDLNQTMNNLSAEIEPIGTAFVELASVSIAAFTQALQNTGISEWIAGVISEFTEAIRVISQEGLEGYAEHEQLKREAEYAEKLEAASSVDNELVTRLANMRAQLEEINAQIDEAFAANENQRAWELTAQQQALINEIAEAEQAVAEAAEKAKKEAKETGDEIGTEMSKGTGKALEEGMAEAGTNAVNDLIATVGQGNEGAQTSGYNMGASIATGLAQSRGLAVAQAEETVRQINSVWANLDTQPAATRSRAAATGGATGTSGRSIVNVDLNMDGRKMGSALLPYINEGMGGSLGAILNT